MYLWGSCGFHAGHRDDVLRFPVRAPCEALDSQPKITSLACGQKHVVVCAGGFLFGFGANQDHQLGDKVSPYLPSVLRIPFRGRTTPCQAACGKRHTLVRTVDGLVYAAGDNSCGQLGHKTAVQDFVEIALGGVVQVAAAGDSSFAVTDNGAVYSWGFAGFGHLGHGSRGENVAACNSKELKQVINVLTPTMIRWFSDKKIKVTEIAVGAQHLVCRSETDVYTCGEGFFGKLGSGDIEALLVPQRVVFPARRTVEKLLAVAAGDHHTVVLKHSGEVGSVVYMFGRSRGDEAVTVPVVIPSPPNVAQIFAGISTSVAVITDTGKLLVWGDFGQAHYSGAPTGAPKFEFSQVRALDDFWVTHFSCSSNTFVALCDDAKHERVVAVERTESPLTTYHETFDTRVPLEDRESKWGTDRFDEARRTFYRRWLGETDGENYFSGIVKDLPKEVVRPVVAKRGARNLKAGDKVRLWMTDVYALGVIGKDAVAQKTDDEGQAPRAQVLVEWVRDDWAPEEIDLWSDDETLDEENPNRWQALWFTEAPVGTNGM